MLEGQALVPACDHTAIGNHGEMKEKKKNEYSGQTVMSWDLTCTSKHFQQIIGCF